MQLLGPNTFVNRQKLHLTQKNPSYMDRIRPCN